MNRRILAILSLAALAACSQAQPGADPVAAIQPLYEPYITDRNPPALLDAVPWTPEMRALLVRSNEVAREGDGSVIDFDPIIDGQDWDIDAVSVTLTAPPADGHAEVSARFANSGEQVQVLYDMIEANGGWRVDNIRTDHWTLRELLANAGITAETQQ